MTGRTTADTVTLSPSPETGVTRVVTSERTPVGEPILERVTIALSTAVLKLPLSVVIPTVEVMPS